MNYAAANKKNYISQNYVACNSYLGYLYDTWKQSVTRREELA